MARKLRFDKWLFIATFALVCVSVVMVYSASAYMAQERFQDQYLFVRKQLMWVLLGGALVSIIMRIDYRTYRSQTVIWSLLGAVTLMLVAVLFARPINGTHRWFALGGFGIQPSELAKLAAIMFAAQTLERRMHRVNEAYYALLPIGIVTSVLTGLIFLEPDYGTAVSLLLLIGLMIFAAGLSYRYMIGAAVVMLPLLYVVLMAASYRRVRFMNFFNPYADPLGSGFQLIQSLIAVGTGGMFGKGLMDGVQKLLYLPEPHSDFVFAVISEELGMLGALAVLLCFSVVAWRGFRAAMLAPDSFGTFLALGLTSMIVVQALVNVSVVLGLLPTKGITLPLVSAGGSSLLINMLAVGVLLNISQHASVGTGDAPARHPRMEATA